MPLQRTGNDSASSIAPVGVTEEESLVKTRAAVLWETGRDWEVVELDLDEPKQGEVLIRWEAAGFCHSDEHLRHGDIVPRFPIVGGHEGAGMIEKVGPGVSRVAEGDHVVTSFLPVCGHCRWCATGHSNICDLGATILEGCLPDGTFRFHGEGQDVGGMCMLGTFSQYSTISETSCVVVDKDLPLDVVVLVGCGVPTGWGSAVYAADVTPGRDRDRLRHRRHRRQRHPGRRPRRRDEPDRRRPAGQQARGGRGPRRHAQRRDRRGGPRARRRS